MSVRYSYIVIFAAWYCKAMIKCIVAVDEKRGMANDNGIPWHLPADVTYYREKTSVGDILMGYGTYLEFKTPFHDHPNYVATSNTEKLRDGFIAVNDARGFLQSFKSSDRDIWVIGGAGLLSQTLDLMDELYITRLKGDFKCTKFLPEYEQSFERVSFSESMTENDIEFQFTVWKHK